MNAHAYDLSHHTDRPSDDVLYAIEAEQALLGALLVRSEAAIKLPQGFSAEHFSEGAHQAIWRAIMQCRDTGKSVNPITVKASLPPSMMGIDIGGRTVSQYLASLASNAVSIINAPDLAEAVLERFQRREAAEVASEISSTAYRAENELSFLDEIREHRDRLERIIAHAQARGEATSSFIDRIDDTFNITADAASGKAVSGIYPGIPEIEQLTGPWQDGHLIVLGGDVKTGKSSAAWQCFFEIAREVSVGGVSGEMPVEQIIMREKARRTGISAKRQKQGKVSSHEIEALLRAGMDIKRLNHIDIVAKQLSLEQIDERINRLQGEHGIKLFVVDHILNLAWSGRMDDADDFKKANRATATLKEIAMKRNLPILALTHINKTGNDNLYGKTFKERLRSAMRRRPTYKSMLGNIDKNVDNMIIVHQAYPAVAGMEPEEGTEDYAYWEEAVREVKGRAEFILALSRENEFPRRKETTWNGERTSFGADFEAAQIGNGRLI